MEQHFDHQTWLSQARAASRDGGQLWHPDWHALAARLRAGHAYQRAMIEGDAAKATPGGSFDPVAARQLIDYTASDPPGSRPCPVAQAPSYRDINLVALGLCKNMSAKEGDIVSLTIPAIEG